MATEINFKEKYDSILDIQPTKVVKKLFKEIVNFNYVGLEIEISVEYKRERYSFIKTLLKKVKALVADNGFFVRDNTIIGAYSFEIVLKPLPINKIKNIYSTLMNIINFSDRSLIFDKSHSCGLHMNFNQYDIKDKNQSHQRLLLFINQKPEYFEENVYKRTIYDFDFKKYLKFQKNISSKYIAVNYLNKKLIEVRNIKVGLSAEEVKKIMIDIISVLYPEKLIRKKSNKSISNMKSILSTTFQKNNSAEIQKSLKKDLLIIKFTKNGPKVIIPNKKIISHIKEKESINQ